MKVRARISSHAQGVWPFALSLLLLVTPVCSVFCKVQACEAPKTAGKSPCHESRSAMADEHGSSSFRSEKGCGLEELPVVLPANPRSPSSDLLGAINRASLLASAEFSTPSDPVLPVHYADLDASPGSHWFGSASASSAIPLRL